MARLYSEQLYIAHNITSGSFTVPDGQVWILRDLSVFTAAPFAGGAAQLVDHESSATFWYAVWDTSTQQQYLPDGNRRIVRPEGSTTDIIINAGLSQGGDILICGYALTLP